MRTSCGLWAGAILALSSAAAAAQEFPKSGEAEYDTYYVFETLASLDSGVGAGGIDEFTGITRNVEGSGPFHDMTVHCLGHWTSIKGEFGFDGSCVETDADGHTVFTTFDDENHYIVGGTGKYAGITGKAPYTAVQLHETAGGRVGRVVNHKVSWEIK
jgi:hypothetical protein